MLNIEETGEIVLRTEVQGDDISFSVSDDGRGIRQKILVEFLIPVTPPGI